MFAPIKLIQKCKTWSQLPMSRRLRWLSDTYHLGVTKLIYTRHLKACGPNTIVRSPLFWTPEFIELGGYVRIWEGYRLEGVNLYGGVQFQPLLKIGDQVSFQQYCHVTFAGNLEIGAGSSLMFNVLVTDIEHKYEELDTPVLQQPLKITHTYIGRNCFIGAGAKIQAGTHLGDHCIVGANAVVRGQFPDRCVIAGVPARIIKRFDPNSVAWRKTNSEGNFI